MNLLAYLPRFERAQRELPELAARENWSRGKIEDFQLLRLNAIWETAVREVPYYRDLARRHGIEPRFGSLDDFCRKVPLLAKSQLAHHRISFLSESKPRGTWHRTSGSTGTTVSVFRTHADHQEMLRMRYAYYAAWNVRILDRTAWVWSTGNGIPPGMAGWPARLCKRTEDFLRQRVRFPANKLGDADLVRYLRKIKRFRPRSVYGFSRAVQLLANKALEVGFHCDSLQAVFLTGEWAPSHLKELVQLAFGVPAAIEYGSVECGFIAGEVPDKTLRVRDDAVFLETLPRRDGFYDIVVTVLTNSAFPLLRYQIGDVTDRPIRREPVGFSILGDIAGRNDDLVQTRTGRYLHPACIDELFELEFAHLVQRYCVHQDRQGEITALILPRLDISDPAIADMARRLSELLEGHTVHLQLVKSVPQTAAGKHRLVTSELHPLKREPAAEPMA